VQYDAQVTRRDLSILIPMLAAVNAQGQSAPSKSGVFSFAKLPVHPSANGGSSRPIFKGKLPTGEQVEMHETTLPPGQMPHPAHRHVHTEMMLIREGTLEFILEGRTEPLGPGDVAYAASNELHALKNTGSNPAQYFVIAIG
jgi:quercetin dioxygenase-like cupin family protein